MKKLGSILFGFTAILVTLFYFGNLYYTAVSFSDGDNAVDVIGQYDETSISDPVPIYTTNRENNAPNRLGINEPQGVSMCGSWPNSYTFVADSGNNRILVFQNDSHHSVADHIPDYVLGQTNFYSKTAGTTQSKLNMPTKITCDQGADRIFVSDTGNNRILVFDISSISDGMNASYVLGQANFVSSGFGTTQSTFNYPLELAYDETRNFLYVVDSSNDRIMIFDVSAITNGENAINVLGQVDFVSSGSGLTDAKFSSPWGVSYDDLDDRLFVADYTNHRVMVFDLTAITDGESAVNVLGQLDFISNSSGTTQSKLKNPISVAYFDEDIGDGGINEFLFVSDKENARVMVFDVSSITDGENAINVLGQEDFVTVDLTIDQDGLYNPQGVAINIEEDPHVLVADLVNQRISIFHVNPGDPNPVTNGQDAVDLIGQYDETSISDPVPIYTTNRQDNSPNRLGFNNPGNSVVDEVNHRFFVSDFSNDRILVYDLNVNNLFDDYIPDYVLGQSNFYSNASGATQSALDGPGQLVYDSSGNRLFVADLYNSRVMIFDVSAITNGENAVNVLGKENFVTSFPETDQDGLSGPTGLAFDDATDLLYVADSTNNRVMVFDVASVADGEDAVSVLGQSDFVSSGAGVTQSNFDNPLKLALNTSNKTLFVADENNHRVMVFDVNAITDGEDATNVLGQADFVSNTSDTTQSTMNLPRGVVYDSGLLFVGDSANNRVLVFSVVSITNGENAVNVLGQENFTSSGANTDQDGLYLPTGLSIDGGANRLYVSDSSNDRIMVFNITPAAGISISHSGGTTVVSETGTQDTFTVVLDALPASNVVLQMLSEQSNEGTISPTTLTFTVDNWSTPQNVIVTGIDDAIDDGDISYNIVISVKDEDSDDAYDLLADVLVPATTLDNDDAPGGGGSQGGGGGPGFPTYIPPAENPPTTPENPIPQTPSDTPNIPDPNLPTETEKPKQPIITKPKVETPKIEIENPISEPSENVIIPQENIETIPEPEIPVSEVLVKENLWEKTKNGLQEILGIALKAIDSTVAKSLAVVGVGSSFVVNALRVVFSNPSGLTDLVMRIWSIFLYGFGIKKRHKPWGVVYDSVTKQPLDPVYLELVDIEKKVLATCFTDIDGRYGFLVEPGHYHITAKKTNYIFPSDKMHGKERDELYTDLYYGNYIEIKEFGDVITKNIPMDRVGFDWNEYAKLEQNRLRWYKRSDKAIGQIVDIFFLVGFLVSGLTLLGDNIKPYNVIIFAFYGILFAFNHTQFGNYARGKAFFKEGNRPIAYGILRLFSAETNNEITHKIIDRLGNYFCLAPNGNYHVSIEQKNPDGSYSKVYEEKNIPIKKGYLKKEFKV